MSSQTAVQPSVDDIMKWEDGEMSEPEAVIFFQKLVDTGMAWQLQGSYGRTAKALILAGLVRAPGQALH